MKWNSRKENLKLKASSFGDMGVARIRGNKLDGWVDKGGKLNTIEEERVSIEKRARVIECSAKEDHNVNEIFQTFLALSRILGTDGNNSCNDGNRIVGQATSSQPSSNPSGKANGAGGLKRRSSTYVSATRGWSSSSGSSSPASEASWRGSESPALLASPDTQAESPLSRSKPRSRSLIRRCSRKAKQQIREAHGGGANDCNIFISLKSAAVNERLDNYTLDKFSWLGDKRKNQNTRHMIYPKSNSVFRSQEGRHETRAKELEIDSGSRSKYLEKGNELFRIVSGNRMEEILAEKDVPQSEGDRISILDHGLNDCWNT
ncbi:hypothetical protein J437_LFUL005941 [Ladona fulva]|uniref:Uncharacterized protein n=1 Tax=Ladona fulva TaxID=123851 RepID=A0A8K0NUW9_LADFU|nr:hypothetical protein J437_LFUL005941 [Ladona fulva]